MLSRLALSALVLSLCTLAHAGVGAGQSRQTITCENKSQGISFNVLLDNFNAQGDEADVKMSVDMKRRFQGQLKREKFIPASSPGSFAISGEGQSRNFSLEIVLSKAQLKKRFKNVMIAAFLDNPLSDQGFYPHRVSVSCTSSLN